MGKKYDTWTKRRRRRLSEALTMLKGRWVNNKELSAVTKIGTIALGNLLRGAVVGELVERRHYTVHQKYYLYYRCRTDNVEELMEAMKPRWALTEQKSIVDPARSESWFAVAERLMQQ